MTGEDFEAVAALLSSGRRFLLTGHRNPDGDSLGSALALAQALEANGKEARVVMRDRRLLTLNESVIKRDATAYRERIIKSLGN